MNDVKINVLMLTWEFPPFITGGLGMACYGLVRSLLELGVRVYLLMPSNSLFYFDLKKPEDADLLPQVFIMKKDAPSEYERAFKSVEERLLYYGVYSTTGGYSGAQKKITADRIGTQDSGQESKKGNGSWIGEVIQTQNSFDLFQKIDEYSVMAWKVAGTLHFDVIHANDWLTFPAALFLRAVAGKPLICHVHSTEFDRSLGMGNKRIHQIEKNGLSICDCVITVSEYSRSTIVDRYGIDRSKVSVVYNAHWVTAKHRNKRIFKEPVVLFLGRITQQKGPGYFLQVARRVIAQFPDVRFIMAGTGDLEKELIQKSAHYRLHAKVLFTGFLKREEVYRILEASDIILLPSISEPFGIAPLEAMSYGVVAIISKQSGAAEILENALKVNFWDIDQMAKIILELLKDPQKLKKIGEAGASEVEKMTWGKAGAEIKKIYEELIC
jgi:glycosyltransferase involved in cell wall biosynthesis